MLNACLAPGRSALIFIEFQEEWVGPEGRLFHMLVKDKDAFRDAIGNAAKILAAARDVGLAIAHAGLDLRDDPNYGLFAGGRQVLGLRGAIPRAGTWTDVGARFVAPFIPGRGEYVVKGRSGASVLKNSTLDPFLRNNRIDTIFLMGFATHVCVESSLREAHDLGYNAYIVSDACAAFDTAQHRHVLDHVVHHFGEAIDSRALISAIRQCGRGN